MSRSIMIASGKGGTGKSTICVNLGLSLAHAGKKVVLIDLNTGLRCLDILLSMENVALWNIVDVMKGNCSLDTAVLQTEIEENLSLLPGTQEAEPAELTQESLYILIDALKSSFDYILIDCPPGIGKIIEMCSECCDEAIIVTNSNDTALRDADALEDKLLRANMYKRSYILNAVNLELVQRGVELKLADVDERMRCSLLGIIQDDTNIKASTNTGVPIVLKRDSYISQNFAKIVDRLETNGEE